MTSSKNKKKITVVTGSRADYGLLTPLIKRIDLDRDLSLQLIVTGSHLSKKFDFTVDKIIEDGFKISKKINMLSPSDLPIAKIKSMGKSLIRFADLFCHNKPDLILLLGDRFEILPVAVAAYINNIPIGHISGGELTFGSIDDGIRHCITKMSWFHFVSTNEYKKRVIQLGENPKNVFNVGSLAIDRIKETKLLLKKDIEKKLNFEFLNKNILITFHSITNKKSSSKKFFLSILRAIKKVKNTKFIFTAPNSDSEGKIIRDLTGRFVKNNPNSSVFFPNLGSTLYLSILKNVDLVLGNSSSGLTEAPYYKIPTINVGNRQEGRIKPRSVIDTSENRIAILKAINKAYSSRFISKLQKSTNHLGNGNSSGKIIKIIKKFKIFKNLQKKFYDLK